MKKIALFCAFGLLSSCGLSPAPPTTATYQIERNGTLATVTVDTTAFGPVSLSPARTFRDDTQPEPLCQRAGQQDQKISFDVPVQCDRIIWTIGFKRLPAAGLDVSNQENSFTDDWSLLSEWNSLPRLNGVGAIDICMAGRCTPLPPPESAPLFVVRGLDQKFFNLGGTTLTLMSDLPELLHDSQDLIPVFQKQIAWLKTTFDVEVTQPWSLVWLGRERSAGNIGGAAGHRIYLVNAPIEQGKPIAKAHKLLLKISAHESIHFLFSAGLPLWANESLAEYYALKSLDKTPYRFGDPVESWDALSEKFPHATTGLYAAQHFVTEQKDYSYYGLFYTKGAAFWAALDQALTHKGQSLDHFITDLKTNWTQSLPSHFVNKIVPIIGQVQWDNLTERYL